MSSEHNVAEPPTCLHVYLPLDGGDEAFYRRQRR